MVRSPGVQIRGLGPGAPGAPAPRGSPSPAAVVAARPGLCGGPAGARGGSCAASRPSPLLPVPGPRGWLRGPLRLSVHVSERDVGSGPGGPVLRRPAGPLRPLSARTRGAPRPGRTRLVVSFSSDRNGVIVRDGKLRRVPTMGTRSCRAV